MYAIEHEIVVLNDTIARLKMHFESGIANRNIPLEDRWALFIKAPDYLKNVPDYMCSGWSRYFGPDYVGYDEQYHAERYRFINAAEVVAHAEDDKQCYEGTWAFFDINEAKEKILADNLLGAQYDW